MAPVGASLLPGIDKIARHEWLSPAILSLGKNAVVAAEDMTLNQALEHLRTQTTLNTLAEDAAVGLSAFVSRQESQ